MRLGIIGDYDPLFRPHVATNKAIEHSMKSLQAKLPRDWIHTNDIEDNFKKVAETIMAFG